MRQTTSSFHWFRKALILSGLSLLFLAGIGQFILSTGAQTAPGERKARINQPRQMRAETTIAITAIRNLQGDRWLRDLEIEVQNNSKKPIYYMELDIDLPDIASLVEGAMRRLTIPLMFGREELIDPGQSASPTDPSIKPGETYIFKLTENDWKGVESHLANRQIQPSVIKNVLLSIYELSYGDGTGFSAGAPLTHQ